MRRAASTIIRLLAPLIIVTIVYLAGPGYGSALMLTGRSVAVAAATPSAVTSHSFRLTPQSATAVGSIAFEYCSNTPLFSEACTPPAGLDVSAAVLSQQTGNTGFVVDAIDTTANRIVINRPPAPAVTTSSTFAFDNITNPSASNATTYVRISTYGGTLGSGPTEDTGAVAFATVTNFAVGAYVPPFIRLCVGVTVAIDCSQASGDSLDLGVLSQFATRAATSQYAASTNDPTGYTVFVLGTTLTSGNNEIPPALNQLNTPGSSQFGLNVRQNTNPVIGSEPDGPGTAIPAGGYNFSNSFSFVPGSLVSAAATANDYSRMTVSYIANVSASQPPGYYVTTLTYLGTAQF